MDHCTGCYTLAFVGEADSFNLDSPLRNFPDGVVLRLQNNSQGEKEYLPCTTECEGAKVRVLHFNRYEPMWFQYGPKIFYSSFISYGGKYNWPYLGASQYWEFTVGEYKDGKNVSMNSLKTNKDGFYLITLAFPPKNSSSGSSNSAAPRPSAPPSASYGGSDLLVRSLTDVDGAVPINRSPSNLVAASSMVYLNSSSSALLSLLGADGSREITTPEAFESLTQQMKFDEFLRVVHILPSIDPAGHLVPEDSNIRVLLPLK